MTITETQPQSPLFPLLPSVQILFAAFCSDFLLFLVLSFDRSDSSGELEDDDDSGALLGRIILVAVVVFLDSEMVNPDQLAIPGNLQFERRNFIDIDFDLEDGCFAPAVSFHAFYHAVSFFYLDRFSNGLWQRIQRRIFGEREKRNCENE
jgi:hypothetical protein